MINNFVTKLNNNSSSGSNNRRLRVSSYVGNVVTWETECRLRGCRVREGSKSRNNFWSGGISTEVDSPWERRER